MDVAYAAEQWRCGSINTDVQNLTFSYAIASSPTSFNLSTKASTPGWIPVASMQFNSPVNKMTAGHVDGNQYANRAGLTYTLPEAIPDGQYVMLRWRDADQLEQDHGLAIDDVKVSWHFEQDYMPLPVELTHFAAKAVNKAVELAWTTASEQNNSHFEIERSTNSISFEQAGIAKGQGTTSLLSNYTFTDKQPIPGISYYRLKQVDEDGTHSYSKIVAVRAEASGTELVAYPTITTKDLRIELPQQQANFQVSVYDKFGSRILQLRLASDQIHTLQVSHLRQGSYVLVAVDELGEQHTTRFLKY
ncbi:T9SS type A sorting domain-containing protein [Pontibacter sp. HJ8]